MKTYLMTKPVLPEGYTAVEYLEGTGTQWIDTGVNAESGLSAKIKMSWSSLIDDRCFLGALIKSTSTSSSKYCYLLHYFNGWCYAHYNYFNGFSSPEANTVYSLSINLDDGNQSFAINRSIKNIQNNTNAFDLQGSLVLFGSKSIAEENTTVGSLCSARAYYVEISLHDIIVRQFVPALNSDGKPCMYDLVSKTPFYNQGSGEFLYGNPIPLTKFFMPLKRIKAPLQRVNIYDGLSIETTVDGYNYEENWTWQQLIDSQYNNGKLTVSSNMLAYITDQSLGRTSIIDAWTLDDEGNPTIITVAPTDVINPNYNYSINAF